MRHAMSAGVTLVELMVTLSVLVIIVAVGVPLFDSVVSNNRVIKQTNDLVGTLILARSEAIKRRLPVSICASADQATCANSNDWSTGWIIFSDNSGTSGVLDGTDVLIQAYQPIGGSSSLSASAFAFLTICFA